jgi:ABC-type Mn2+/Zn2+ transport system permease subunit
MNWLVDPFQSQFSQRAALVCVMVGVLAPVVGTWVSLRRLAYMGDAMAHSVLGGVAFGVVAFGTGAVLPGALTAAVLMAVLIHLLSQNRRLGGDSVIAIVGSGLFALGVLVLSRADTRVSVTDFLFGQMLTVSWADVWITLSLTVVGLGFIADRFADLKMSTFDPDHAFQVGINVRRLDAALLVVLAVSVVVCLSTVGTVLTVALLITPTSTARLVFSSVRTITAGAVALGLAEVLLGFVFAYHGDLPPGPVITVLATVVFVVVYVVRLGSSDRTFVSHSHRHEGPLHVHDH